MATVLNFLQDNGVWIAAVATFALALFAAWSVCEARRSRKLSETAVEDNRRIAEENRRLADQARVRELLGQGLEPLLDCVRAIKYHVTHPGLGIIGGDLIIKERTKYIFDSPWPHYPELGEMIGGLLIEKMEAYDRKAKAFYDSTAKLDLDSTKEKMEQQAIDFALDLQEIEAALLQIRSKYQIDYHLTNDELERESGRFRAKQLRKLKAKVERNRAHPHSDP